MILFRDTVMDKALPAKLLRYELDIAGYFAIFFVFALHQITQILWRFGPDIQPEKLQLCAYLCSPDAGFISAINRVFPDPSAP